MTRELPFPSSLKASVMLYIQAATLRTALFVRQLLQITYLCCPFGKLCDWCTQQGHQHRLFLNSHSMGSQPTASEAVPWAELPVSTWAAVLSHVDVEHRLTVCAVVSQQLKEAALAATTATVLRVTPAKCAAMQQWLRRYEGKHNVRRVELIGYAVKIRNMPFSGLQQLRLCLIPVQLGQHDSHPGLLSGASSLQWLSLDSCYLLGGIYCLAGLAALPFLQHLELRHLRHSLQGGRPAWPLSGCQHLTHLSLEGPLWQYEGPSQSALQQRQYSADAVSHDSRGLAAVSALSCLLELHVQVRLCVAHKHDS